MTSAAPPNPTRPNQPPASDINAPGTAPRELDPLQLDPLAPTTQAWWERPLLFAITFSLFCHVAMALIGATVRVADNSVGGLGDAQVVSIGDSQETLLTSLGPVALGGGELGGVTSIADAQSFSVDDLSSPFAEADRLTTDTTISTLSGAGDSTGSGTGSGQGLGDGIGLSGAGGGSARFFGVEARGERFAFVVDVSGSMQESVKLAALKSSLTDALEGLLEQARFCVVLFNSDAQPLLTAHWSKGNAESKERARRAVRAINPQGGTNPITAIETIFKIQPRPDAVYFMTDGAFTSQIEAELPGIIERLQRDSDKRIPFYCITFVERGSERLMRGIAAQSGGSYTHVEAPATTQP